MQQLSSRMARILERLAEMFPKSHYQSELDRYIAGKHPKNAADLEQITKEFEYRNQRGILQ